MQFRTDEQIRGITDPDFTVWVGQRPVKVVVTHDALHDRGGTTGPESNQVLAHRYKQELDDAVGQCLAGMERIGTLPEFLAFDSVARELVVTWNQAGRRFKASFRR